MNGSTFHFTARFGAATSAEPTVMQMAQELVGTRVLVADDKTLALEIATDLLRQFGMAVATTSTGEEVLERLQTAMAHEEAFDLLVLSWKMPGADLQRCLERLQLQYTEPPPVLVLSACVREQLEKSSL